MQHTRRKFVLTAGLVAGGAALGGVQALAAGGKSSTEREVDAVISRYGNAVKVTKDGAKAEYRVKVGSVKQFVEVFDPKSLPFEQIRVSDGNTMQFKHGGMDVTIVHLA